MLKKVVYLACLALVLGVVPYTYAQDSNPVIAKTGVAPLIDGQIDTIWSVVNSYNIANAVSGSTAPDNESDCSGTWKAYWDDQYFYILYEIKDDDLSGDATDIGQKYQDDSVEIFFDIGDTKDSTYGDNHFQYRFGYDPQNVAAGTIGADHTTNTIDGIVAAWKTTTNGYIVEAKIPWGTLNATPATGDVMGFEAQINDDDAGGNRDHQLAWHATENQAYQNPSHFGTVSLGTSLKPINKATEPNPGNKSKDIDQSTNLSWKSGNYIVEDGGAHQVFFGIDFNDVNESTVDILLGNTAFVELTADSNTLDPSTIFNIEFGVTYYWRVDEINEPASEGGYKGTVWSFTVENASLDLPFAKVKKVTVSSSVPSNDPNNTINGAGLGADPNFPNQHNSTGDSWISEAVAPNNVWVQYDFDRTYKIHDMQVWNYNVKYFTKSGFKEVLVQYSEDEGQTWIDIPDINEFKEAPGKADYDPIASGENYFNMNDIIANSIRITALSNFGKLSSGLSEVRFTYVPLRARRPSIASDTNDVDVESVLSWRSGREAVTHELYFDTNETNVEKGFVTPITLTESRYVPDLSLGVTYYWRVDEVNPDMIPSVWEGFVWKFATPSHILIDGFETGYGSDPDVDAVYQTWKDSFILQNQSVNGSWLGTDNPPFLHTINHSGRYSAPLGFNNNGVDKSEIIADTSKLLNGSDWSIGNPKTLTIWFRGDPNVTEVADMQLYCKIGNTKRVYTGSIDTLMTDIWRQWDIDLAGMNISNVSTVTIGIENNGSNGSSGMIYLDDIMLTGDEPKVNYPETFIEAEDCVEILPPMEVNSVEVGETPIMGGEYIHVKNNTPQSTTEPPTDGIVTYEVDLEGGQYVIWGRVSIPVANNDSFWVTVEGATTNVDLGDITWCKWNLIPQGAAWHWDDVHHNIDDNNNPTVIWTVPEGLTTIKIAYRDTHATTPPRIDTLMIEKVGE